MALQNTQALSSELRYVMKSYFFGNSSGIYRNSRVPLPSAVMGQRKNAPFVSCVKAPRRAIQSRSTSPANGNYNPYLNSKLYPNGANSQSALPSFCTNSNDPSYKLSKEIKKLIDIEPLIKNHIPDLLERPKETFLADLQTVLESFVSTERANERSFNKIEQDAIEMFGEATKRKDPAYTKEREQTFTETIKKLDTAFAKLVKFKAVFQKLSKLNKAFVPQLKIYLSRIASVNQKENLKVISSQMDRLSQFSQAWHLGKVNKRVQFQEAPHIRLFCGD